MTRRTSICLIGLVILVGCRRAPTPAPTPTPTPTPEATVDDERIAHLRNIGLAYIEASMNEDATRVFDELIDLLPDDAMPPANRALVALRESDLTTARQHLDRAAELAPDHADVALLRAHAAIFEGQRDAALAILTDAVVASPEHVRCRWTLVDLLQQSGAAADAVPHLAVLAESSPGNVVVRAGLARAHVAAADAEAALADLDALASQLDADASQSRSFLDTAVGQLGRGEMGPARASLTAMTNTLKPTQAWQEDLARLRGPPVLVAEPVWNFTAHELPVPPVAEPLDIRYRDVSDAIGLDDITVDAATLRRDAGTLEIVAAYGNALTIHRANDEGTFEAAAEITIDAGTARVTVVESIDWNNDRRTDIICGLSDGTLRFITQGEDGAWTGLAEEPAAGDEPVDLIVPFDVDLDGDLDLLIGCRTSTTVLRNEGQGRFGVMGDELQLDFASTGDPGLRAVTVADLDDDGDRDLVTVGGIGTVAVFDSLRAGRYAWHDASIANTNPVAAAVAADVDNDGWIDVAFVEERGEVILRSNRAGGQATRVDLPPAVTQEPRRAPAGVGTYLGHACATLDADNDGWLDLLIVSGGVVSMLQNQHDLAFSPVPALPRLDLAVRAVEPVDHDGDGDVDVFLVLDDGRCRLWENTTAGTYGWQSVRLEAILQGGQRNNSAGIGGTIEVRTGGMYQKHLVTGPETHIGLGVAERIDAVRVIWPNGVPQSVILPEPKQVLVEAELLKGSCPYLLVREGGELRFVTDLLWRSPLGMRINGQLVAPIATTSDYVKIAGDVLRPRDGELELIISATLWETHFFDGVTLFAVDHPPDVDVFVDERFLAPSPPPFRIHAVPILRTPVEAVDQRGIDVLDVIAERDGRRLGGFAKGDYQGVAEPHWVELDLGAWDETETVRLVASGWIMPTDTSINVAIGQGEHDLPTPMSVSVPDGAGGWRTVIENAGFPAGKLKTVVLDLTGLLPAADHRVRLSTNLEIYWDRLAVGLGTPTQPITPAPLATRSAELEYLGFPTIVRRDRLTPELPDYSTLSRTQRWRDLEGFYTRHGDVHELLVTVDDRYVIMNAGDAMRLTFEAGAPPPEGWTRDYVLFSDGWVKDGDWNTVASRTVAPLPFHDMTSYPYDERDAPPTLRPEHPDWTEYHTRYVTPIAFRDSMKPSPGDDRASTWRGE